MNYFDAFLELLKGKKELLKKGDNCVTVTLGEVADYWKRENAFIKNTGYDLLTKWGFNASSKYADKVFLNDVLLVIKKLENEKCISLPDKTGDDFFKKTLLKMKVPEDKICLKIEKEFDDYYKKTISGGVFKKAIYLNGVLKFLGKEIDFNNKQNQKELLDTLFSEPEKDWFYDEIQSEWDVEWDGIKKNDPGIKKEYWRKFYNSGDSINRYIATKTGVADFILKNTGTGGKIKINPRYV